MKEKMRKFFKSVPGKIMILAFSLFLVGFLVYEFHYKNLFVFKENETLFLEGTKEYLERNPNKLPRDDSFTEISLMDMYKMEYVDSLYIPGKNRVCSENGFVRVINNNGVYSYLVSLTCGKYKSKIDSISPSITLKGDTPLVLHLGDTYVEPGIDKVEDNKDKLKIEDVKIDTSRLDLKNTGVYKVVYTVYDNTYNKTTVEREVIVADTLSGKIEREMGANYTYKGRVDNNYVLFSGMLFRIVKVNDNHEVMLITEDNISNLLYKTGNGTYPESNIYTWLNETFYNHLSKRSQSFVKESTWCYDMQDALTTPNHCTNKVDAKVGLLTLNDYLNTKEGTTSYLLNNAKFVFLNLANNNTTWVSDLYSQELVQQNKVDTLLGVRLVIVLKSDICITSGNGTISSPYKLQDYNYGLENDKLNSRLIGEYVMYSGYTFQISKLLEDGTIELTSSELMKNQTTRDFLNITFQENTSIIPNVEEEGNFYYQLNNNLINHISEESLVKREYELPIIDNTKKYNELEKTTISSYLSVPASYEMFSGFNHGQEDRIYYLSDYSENLVTFINGSNGVGFQLNKMTFPTNAVKIKITLNKNMKIISGKGTRDNPYYVK